LSRARNTVAPAPDDLVNHFAKKMSNGRDDFDEGEWSPRDPKRVTLRSFHVRFATVLSTLQGLNLSKSVNGFHPRLLKKCADEVAPALCNLFKCIVADGSFPES
jgi:hypothetical protein